MIKHYKALFNQYLLQLEDEIRDFPDEHLWSVSGKINNSAGNLGLHLCGNLQFFIGAMLGDNGYIRHRDEEFTSRVSKKELVDLIQHTRMVVADVFGKMQDNELFVVRKFDLRSLTEPVTTGFFLAHLAAHLGYHLGQLNYYRRLLRFEGKFENLAI